jgi:hypothetical protein
VLQKDVSFAIHFFDSLRLMATRGVFRPQGDAVFQSRSPEAFTHSQGNAVFQSRSPEAFYPPARRAVFDALTLAAARLVTA